MPLPPDLLAALREFPAHVRTRAAEIAPARWADSPAAGEFALVEHACQLRDFEVEGCQPRIARMLAEDEPRLAAPTDRELARTARYGAEGVITLARLVEDLRPAP